MAPQTELFVFFAGEPEHASLKTQQGTVYCCPLNETHLSRKDESAHLHYSDDSGI